MGIVVVLRRQNFYHERHEEHENKGDYLATDFTGFTDFFVEVASSALFYKAFRSV